MCRPFLKNLELRVCFGLFGKEECLCLFNESFRNSLLFLTKIVDGTHPVTKTFLENQLCVRSSGDTQMTKGQTWC